MVGRKAAPMGYSLYASRDYLARHGRLVDLDFNGHAVCHYHPSIEYFSTAKWLKRHARNPLSQLKQELLDELDRFTGNAYDDDVSFLALRARDEVPA